MKKYDALKGKFSAAEMLLSESVTTREKISSLASLLTGANPKLDTHLRNLQKRLTDLGNIEKGDIIQLSADNLPEDTEEHKKRKRALLLFIKTWKDLQSEFARVRNEMENAEANGTQDTSLWAKIFGAAKGPLAIVTVLAIGAAALHTTAVEITIENDGCGTIESASSVPISLPGLTLPNEAIVSGDSAVATVPPLSLTVDGTNSSALSIKSLGFSLSIELGNGIDDITFDGSSLLGSQTELSLGSAQSHTLVISCR